ncbi:MAG TPA: TonB-dependent receptor [Candidatus Elarobacter sp.]|nr:TonB-dependent receptor [Candidatus Elarobacter sp.]
MRTLLRVSAAAALAYLSLVGPVSAATKPEAIAQASAATTVAITGRVVDSRGAPLSGASVLVEGGGQTYRATSANDGSFSVNLPPGVYTITVNHGGFQTQQNDLAVVAGQPASIGVTMQELNLSSLRVIGRTGVSVNRTPFNVSESSISTLPPIEIQLRQNNNLTDTLATIPGVFASRTFSATPNTSFVVRGGAVQTRVTIDGHPVSSGISGQWNTNYAVSGIFQDAEVVKGTGLNGALAGESAVGTVNIRTRDFTRNNSAGLQIGTDSFAGGIYNAYADVNFLKDNKASLIVAKSFIGFNGPWDNYFGNRNGITSAITPGTGNVPAIIGLDQFRGDFSNRYSLQGELAKLRYRFNETSSVTLEYLGLQGQYQPQGGAYSTYLGQMTLQACRNGTTFQAALATCTSQSNYTAPYTFNDIGNTLPAYTWFPNSFIQNNEPQFAAEFRTAYKGDTILFRPYTHLINRFISGVNENKYPGNGGNNNPGAWFAVTNVANCQVKFLAPGATGGPATGAAGPCFPSNMQPNSPSYIGGDPTQHVFATTGTAPVCSPTPPFTCFTTNTAIENDGAFGYGTPFSQPELDRLNGYTFSWVHPAGANIYNFSYDYRKDFTQSASTDQTQAAAGCSFVIGGVTGTSVFVRNATPGGLPVGSPYQPTCSTAHFGAAVTAATPYANYNILPRSSIGTPPTVSQFQDFALTGTWQLGDKLRVALGNYYEIFRLNAQIENPTVLDLYARMGNSNAAPVALVTRSAQYSHYDPHFGFEWRASPNLSFRGNAGSSITQPYAGLVSGFGSISIPNAAAHNYTNTIPNFGLKPETTVSYSLGFDNRFHDGSVFSMDLYNLTVHDVFLSNSTVIGTAANPPPGLGGITTFSDTLFINSNQINGPIQRSYGLEAQMSHIPAFGLGYYLSMTLQRAYYDQLPLSIYLANNSNTFGNFNVSGAQIFGYPFAKGYGQLIWQGTRGTAFELGADWEGQDNSTLGPPYVIWDASARIPLHPKVALQISVQNLFNLDRGTLLGRNLSGQGNIEPTLYLPTGTKTLLPSGAATSLQALPPRTFRFTLNFNTGT